MNIQKIIIAAIALFLAVGCGSQGGTLNLKLDNASSASSGGDSTGGNNSGKPLQSLWTDATNNFYQIDLRSTLIGTASQLTVKTILNDTCTCQALLQGSESSGTAAISNCSGASSSPLYTCADFNISGTYTNSAGTLSICNAANQCQILK